LGAAFQRRRGIARYQQQNAAKVTANMNTTVTRPRTTVALQQAAAQGTATRPSNGCKDCVKTGLAILPVIPTVAPTRLRDKTPELGTLDDMYLPEGLKEHWYVLRTLPTGYLYVFKESDKSWDAYLVDAAGLLRMMPTGAMPATPAGATPMSDACRRAGDNVPAQVIAIDPKKYPSIWMAYSRYRWTPQVLADFAADKDGRRTQRMSQIDVTAAAAGQLGSTSVVKNGVAMSAGVGRYVACYASGTTRAELNKNLITPLQGRHEQAAALATKMAAISKDTGGKTGCLIALTDPVGNAIELGASRDGYAYKVAEATGLFDADGKRARARVVAEMVEAVRANAQKNPGPWYDRNYGPDRFMKHVNKDAVQAALADGKAFKDNLAKVDLCSSDYVTVKESALWKAVQKWDFDAGDDVSSLDHSQMVADSVRGSGVTKLEKERVWFPVLVDMQAADPENWFYRSMAALHPDLQAYFDANKQWDKEYEDVPKAMASLVRDITFESTKEITKIHAAIRMKRGANQATADIIEGVTSLLLHLREKDPKAYQKLIRRTTVALITRADLVAQPVLVKGRYNQLVQMIQSVAAGDAKLVGDAPVGVRPGAVDRSYMAQKGNLGGKGLSLSQGVDGAVLLDLPSDKNEVRSVGAWMVGKLQDGGKLSSADLGRLQLRTVDLTLPSTVPAENVWLKNLLDKRANQSNVVLSGFATFLQIVAAGNAAKDLFTKPGAMNKGDATIGITTAVLSLIAAALEVSTAVVALRGGEAAAKTAMRTRLIAKLAGDANLIEGGWLLFKGGKRVFDGDRDSGWWTVGSGIFLIAGGITTIVGGGLVASAIAAGTSALTLPIIGWAVATIILLGLSIWCLVNAFSTDDNNLLPLEYWLDNGTFGKGAHRSKEESPFYNQATKATAQPFATLNDEVREFQRLVFAAAGEITGATDRGGNGILSNYEVALPRWVVTSILDIELHGTTDGKTTRKIAQFKFSNGKDKADQIWYLPQAFGMCQDPKIEIDRAIGTARIKGYVSNPQPGGIAESVEDFFEWIGATDEKDGRIYTKDVRMIVNYWPDAEGMPDIKQTLSDWSIRSGK
jgi:hypothetical protein